MTDYQTGEIVDITIKGARVSRTDDDAGSTLLTVTYGGRNFRTTLDLDEFVTVERIAPADWPPKPGDLWRDRFKNPWFAFDGTDTDDYAPGTRIRFGSVSTHQYGQDKDPAEVNKQYGPMTLKHRDRVCGEAGMDWPNGPENPPVPTEPCQLDIHHETRHDWDTTTINDENPPF